MQSSPAVPQLPPAPAAPFEVRPRPTSGLFNLFTSAAMAGGIAAMAYRVFILEQRVEALEKRPRLQSSSRTHFRPVVSEPEIAAPPPADPVPIQETASRVEREVEEAAAVYAAADEEDEAPP